MKYLVLLVALSVTMVGCMSTSPGNRLSDITPSLGEDQGAVQHTVEGYSFHLDGGKLVTSNMMGKLLNTVVFNHWEATGRIAEHEGVSAFDDKSKYHITLSGTQEGDSSVGLQILSGLTLGMVPYSVNTTYAMEYELVNPKTGCRYKAKAVDSVKTTVGWVMLPMALFGSSGQDVTLTRISNHLYAQLQKQGAFNPDKPCN